jgi:hypothetical protein
LRAAQTQGPLTARSASAPVTIFKPGSTRSGCSGIPSPTLHMREVQASNAHPPWTQAQHSFVSLSETSWKILEKSLLPTDLLLRYKTRPSFPVTCIGEYDPYNTNLSCHMPPRCSMHMEASPFLRYKMRPSSPLSCVGEYGPLMQAAKGPLAPLMKMTVALELPSAIAAASVST